eukprot:UN04629
MGRNKSLQTTKKTSMKIIYAGNIDTIYSGDAKTKNETESTEVMNRVAAFDALLEETEEDERNERATALEDLIEEDNRKDALSKLFEEDEEAEEKEVKRIAKLINAGKTAKLESTSYINRLLTHKFTLQGYKTLGKSIASSIGFNDFQLSIICKKIIKK